MATPAAPKAITARRRARNPDFVVALDPTSELPVYLQIARAIADDVRRARLRPGDALPGSRTLARTLKVHRNTVLAAYTELVAEGWVTTEMAGGTFVANDPPTHSRLGGLRSGLAPAPAYPLAAPLFNDNPPTYRPGFLLLARGLPNVRLLPTVAIARAYRRVLARDGRELLTYGHPRGHPRLRAALASMLSTARGIPASADTVLVTRGSQMALDLTARALFAPGDIVAVEALGQRASWNAFRYAGARLVPVAVDDDGIRVDALTEIVARHPLRAIYVTPQNQFPTTAVLSPERRVQLLSFAQRHRVVVIEDDYDHEFRYDGRPLMPLASGDRAGVVVYVGTLSKVLAPGLRVGFVVAPQPVIDRLAAIRIANDLQGDLAVQCAMAELFETGEFGRHIRRMRRTYRSRRDALAAALETELGNVVQFAVPAGGMALWARVAQGVDIDEWAHSASALGVIFRGGRPYAFADEPVPCTRLGFTFHNEAELRDAVRRMAVALDRVRKGRRS